MRAEHDHRCHYLDTALLLTCIFAAVELAGGWWANSLALVADAVHMVSDVLALGMASVARRIAAHPAHMQMTYGYGRAKVLAAQANGLGLWFLSGWIVWEAVGRLSSPPVVNGGMVLGIAVIGLFINLIVLKWLRGSHDFNTRSAFWHVLGDALGSVAAIVAGSVILLTGWMPIDPILSFLVAIILAWGGWRIVRETTLDLMEGVPFDVNVQDIETLMLQIKGILGIHHVHVWRLPDGQLAMSAHVQVMAMDDWPSILPLLLESLNNQDVRHATLQPEMGCQDNKGHCLEKNR